MHRVDLGLREPEIELLIASFVFTWSAHCFNLSCRAHASSGVIGATDLPLSRGFRYRKPHLATLLGLYRTAGMARARSAVACKNKHSAKTCRAMPCVTDNSNRGVRRPIKAACPTMASHQD